MLLVVFLSALSSPAQETWAGELPAERLFITCAGCHEREAGKPHRVGPNLHALAGRTAGTAEGFSYSPALAASGLVWDAGTLTGWILAPEAMVPGTWMLYHNHLQPSEVTLLVNYLLQDAE
jgi:cytochrome c